MDDRLVLHEYRTAQAVPLDDRQVTALRRIVPNLAIVPAAGEPGRFDVTPAATVGTIHIEGREIEIRPKIPLDRLLFLISYSMDAVRWQPEEVSYQEADTLVAAMAGLFAHHVRHALEPGVLHGYRSEDDALHTVRGRIRFGDQLRRRYGDRLPLEVSYDDFTDDIFENRILKAAIWRLGRFRLPQAVASRLGRFDRLLERVTHEPHVDASMPIAWSRLNERYRPAIAFARLILASASLETGGSGQRAPGLLVNMNRVFENFVVAALRRAMGLSEHQLVQGATDRSLYLDSGRLIGLAPDLSWWRQGHCHLIGDAKYKRLSASGIKHPDLYQLLAYLVATGLPAGVLVYPRTETDQADHDVPGAAARLMVRTLDLGGEPREILDGVSRLAAELQQFDPPDVVPVGIPLVPLAR